jgi:uncharacterized membrane protein
MSTARLETFSDGVLAIVITIMVLELKPADELSLHTLARQLPVLLSYLLSFVMVAIVWVNHHHVFHLLTSPSAGVLWLNNHLLFWVSLVPFVTADVGRNSDRPLAAAAYGFVMLGSAVAFALLRAAVAKASGQQFKELHRTAHVRNALGVALYGASMPLAWWHTSAAYLIFVVVAAMYFLPERQIEEALEVDP